MTFRTVKGLWAELYLALGFNGISDEFIEKMLERLEAELGQDHHYVKKLKQNWERLK